MDGRQGKAKPGKGKARVNKRDTQADIGPLFFTPAHRGAQRTEVKLNVNIRAYMQRTRDVQKEHANISSADTADVWLTKPEIPTSAEVLGIEEGGAIDDESEQSEVELEPNIIAGPWPDTTTYLRAHYQLLREDIVAPLRDAAAFMQDDPSRNEEDRVDLQIYDKVHIAGFTFAPYGIAARVRFSLGRVGKQINWEHSKRLIPGTTVAVSPAEDCFESKCFVGVVANRALEGVMCHPPEIDIYFANPEDVEVDPQKEFIMVEAKSGYLEASRHTLRALQKLHSECFPLQEHLVRLQHQVHPPEYLVQDPHVNLSSTFKNPEQRSRMESVNIVDNWPEPPEEVLDASQWDALRQILTKRLAVIQGPPGTGKTHVSVAALKILLDNRKPGDAPIVICSQTNHALDQILRHVGVFESNYARIGGRSSDPEVKQHSVYELRLKTNIPSLPGCQLNAAVKAQAHLWDQAQEKVFNHLQNTKRTLSGKLLHELGLISEIQLQSLEDGASEWIRPDESEAVDCLEVWLGNQLAEFRVDYVQETFGFEVDEEDLEYEQLKELEAEQGVGEEDENDGLRGPSCFLHERYTGKHNPAIQEKTIEQLMKAPDLWRINQNMRGSIYCYIQRRVKALLRERLIQIARDYEVQAERVKVGRWERDCVLLEQANVVGLTTTGMSKYRPLIAALKPKIIFVEEAAEVIESPVIATCLESVEHLVLVGDHKQLQGHCSVPELESEPYFLAISLFERLVNNGFEYKTLTRQRRMAPEIRRALAPIYDDLQDHDCVLDRERVPGMGDVASFFFCHTWPEAVDGTMSKYNADEARMIEGFYIYLYHNGMKTTDITILTFYNGQRKKILKALKQHPVLQGQYVKVMTVDSYQGEENEVVLLSLVRSSTKGDIGFLKNENRICVAMSRAKRGFYIFGNGMQLSSASGLWWEICRIMSKNPRRVGFRIPITCEKHDQQSFIGDPNDWENTSGGCAMLCPERLGCGHPCPLRCHARDHNEVICYDPCSRVLTCGHQCTEVCSSQTCSCPSCGTKEDKLNSSHAHTGNPQFSSNISSASGPDAMSQHSRSSSHASKAALSRQPTGPEDAPRNAARTESVYTERRFTPKEYAERIRGYQDFGKNEAKKQTEFEQALKAEKTEKAEKADAPGTQSDTVPRSDYEQMKMMYENVKAALEAKAGNANQNLEPAQASSSRTMELPIRGPPTQTSTNTRPMVDRPQVAQPTSSLENTDNQGKPMPEYIAKALADCEDEKPRWTKGYKYLPHQKDWREGFDDPWENPNRKYTPPPPGKLPNVWE